MLKERSASATEISSVQKIRNKTQMLGNNVLRFNLCNLFSSSNGSKIDESIFARWIFFKSFNSSITSRVWHFSTID